MPATRASFRGQIDYVLTIWYELGAMAREMERVMCGSALIEGGEFRSGGLCGKLRKGAGQSRGLHLTKLYDVLPPGAWSRPRRGGFELDGGPLPAQAGSRIACNCVVYKRTPHTPSAATCCGGVHGTSKGCRGTDIGSRLCDG